MKRSSLRKSFLKQKSEVSRKADTTRRNYCANLLRKTKREYFANIKINNIADSKKLRRTVKALFFDKINHKEVINLIDNGFTLVSEEEIGEAFNKDFCNIAKNVSLPKNRSIKEPSIELFSDPVTLVLDKCRSYLKFLECENAKKKKIKEGIARGYRLQ